LAREEKTVGAVKEVYDRPYKPEAAAKIIDKSREMQQRGSAQTEASRNQGRYVEGQDNPPRKGWFSRGGKD
jgi:hypothetical protein